HDPGVLHAFGARTGGGEDGAARSGREVIRSLAFEHVDPPPVVLRIHEADVELPAAVRAPDQRAALDRGRGEFLLAHAPDVAEADPILALRHATLDPAPQLARLAEPVVE